MTVLTSNPPTLPGYGLAIWNDTGDLITGFNGNETVFREVFRASFSGAENVEITVPGTLAAGLDNTNCVVITNYSNGSGYTQTNVGYISGNQVKIRPVGTTSTTRSGVVAVQQYREATPLVGSYGMSIQNGNNDTVLDPGAAVWSVKATGTLPNTSGWTRYGTYIPGPAGAFDEHAVWYKLSLPANTYSTSKPFAVAVRCTEDYFIIQPYIFSNASGYYQEVIFHAPATSTGVYLTYEYAILVSPYDFTPVEDSGTYGLELFDSSGYKFWSSRWRQGIIQELIDLNQFTSGVNQNGTYDYETGYDGVTAPVVAESSDPYSRALNTSQGQIKSVSVSVDPLNTYAMFWAGNGNVKYYRCDTGDGVEGGGQHWPAVRFIEGGSSVELKMYRTAEGPSPPVAEYGERVPDSFHPTGYVSLIRII
jgi:hypothetical protein